MLMVTMMLESRSLKLCYDQLVRVLYEYFHKTNSKRISCWKHQHHSTAHDRALLIPSAGKNLCIIH